MFVAADIHMLRQSCTTMVPSERAPFPVSPSPLFKDQQLCVCDSLGRVFLCHIRIPLELNEFSGHTPSVLTSTHCDIDLMRRKARRLRCTTSASQQATEICLEDNVSNRTSPLLWPRVRLTPCVAISPNQDVAGLGATAHICNGVDVDQFSKSSLRSWLNNIAAELPLQTCAICVCV